MSKKLDLEAYSGLWYEVGRKNAWFEVGCAGATAYYTVIPQGLSVLNTCLGPNGQALRQIKGIATPTAKPLVFNIKFETGQTGIYRILYTDYQYFSIVGDVKTQYLSILSRKRMITDSEQILLTKIVKDLGFTGVEWL